MTALAAPGVYAQDRQVGAGQSDEEQPHEIAIILHLPEEIDGKILA